MPYVYVRSRPGSVDGGVRDLVMGELRQIVAKHLSTPAHPLDVLSVELFVSDIGPYDVTVRDMIIEVRAHRYPDRAELDLDAVAKAIGRDLHEATSSGLPNMAVWIQLFEGGFFATWPAIPRMTDRSTQK